MYEFEVEHEHAAATASPLWDPPAPGDKKGAAHSTGEVSPAPAGGAMENPHASAALAAPLFAHWGVSDTFPLVPEMLVDDGAGMPQFVPVRTDAQVEVHGQEEHTHGTAARPAQEKDDADKKEDGNQKSSKPSTEATGIGHSISIGRFVTAAHEVEAQWGKLKPQARADKVAAAANEELGRAGVPKTTTKLEELAPKNAHFAFTLWQLGLSKHDFTAQSMTRADAAAVASTVYHEARHAEQWHRMARLLAGQGKKASEIATTMHIPARIAADAAKKPLTATGTEGKEATSWYDSVYGANAAARNKTLTNLKTLAKKRNDAAIESNKRGAEYQKLAKDPKVAPKVLAAALARWKAAYAKWQAAVKEQQANYQAYRNLPEEADAWKIGSSVTAAYPKEAKPKGP